MAEWFAEGTYNALEEQNCEVFDHACITYCTQFESRWILSWKLEDYAQGKDLNREWDNYDNEIDAPEVFYVRRDILKTGAALVLDIHGDETILMCSLRVED